MAFRRPHPPLPLAMALVATLPALPLAWALLGSGRPPLQVAGWLLLGVVPGVGAAFLLAGWVTRPLAALELALRNFDPEAGAEQPPPPAGAPREVAVLFDRLGALGEQLHASLRQLRDARRRGDAVHHELVTVIAARDREISGRGAALQEAQLALERQTRTDALTGAANRRGFAEFLERAWRLAMREQQPLSILMVDIDPLPGVDAARGAERWDACIQAVANAIQHLVGRAGDLVAHHGGGRFVVLLGNTALEGALRLAEQLRATVEGLQIAPPCAPGNGVLTVSVGVTSALPPRGARAEPTLSAAERALEAAIEQGRNQVAYSTAARTGLFQSLCLPNEPTSRPC